jgi:hypothetical protein
MKKQTPFVYLILLFVMISCLTASGQEKDSLTLPWEVRLNERQPPDTVLKTIGIKPGMIIGPDCFPDWTRRTDLRERYRKKISRVSRKAM